MRALKRTTIGQIRLCPKTHNICILALYNEFIIPNELDKDTDFLKYQFTDLLLRSLGVEQEYAFSDLITAKYFHEDQLGNITAMTAGAIDVRSIL